MTDATAAQTVSDAYLLGISDARQVLRRFAAEGHAIDRPFIEAELDIINRTLRGFGAQSLVGQMLRGERDFWQQQLAKLASAAPGTDA